MERIEVINTFLSLTHIGTLLCPINLQGELFCVNLYCTRLVLFLLTRIFNHGRGFKLRFESITFHDSVEVIIK